MYFNTCLPTVYCFLFSGYKMFEGELEWCVDFALFFPNEGKLAK